MVLACYKKIGAMKYHAILCLKYDIRKTTM